jgi:hypothetical protein
MTARRPISLRRQNGEGGSYASRGKSGCSAGYSA